MELIALPDYRGDAPRGRTVIAGEALVDLVPAGAGDTLAAHPGGGPYNVARAAARLGAPAAFLGRLSTDRFGTRLRSALREDGVDLSAAVATDDPTTLALAEVDADGAATYRFYADGTSAPGLAEATLPPDAAVLCVGTLGLVFDPCATTLARLAGGAPDGVLVAVDPNCRPAAIAGDEPAYRARLARVLARADLVKASADDLAWLCPGAAPAEAMRALAGGAAGVVTLGGDGALVVTPDGVTAVPAPATDVVDTIGAGDAFLGGLLAWWHAAGRGRADLADGAALTAAAAFACGVAAQTCARAGADPPGRDQALAAAAELAPPAAEPASSARRRTT